MTVPLPGRRSLGAAALLLLMTACHPPGPAQSVSLSPAPPAHTRTATPAPTARPTQDASRQDAARGLTWIDLSALPRQGQQTYRLILAGGPFPYARDGVVFQNREGILPVRPRGTYHEYTVKTPGSSDRGARRIICAAVPECYYTADHYASFQRIRP